MSTACGIIVSRFVFTKETGNYVFDIFIQKTLSISTIRLHKKITQTFTGS